MRPAILEERLKPRWREAKFAAWRTHKRVLWRFCGGIVAGSLADGTVGVPATLVIGDHNVGSMRGTRPVPGSALFRAGLAAARSVIRAGVPAGDAVRVPEHRTTVCHASRACGGAAMAKVLVQTYATKRDRVKAESRRAAAAAAAAAAGLLPRLPYVPRE